MAIVFFRANTVVAHLARTGKQIGARNSGSTGLTSGGQKPHIGAGINHGHQAGSSTVRECSNELMKTIFCKINQHPSYENH
jgi:hypothetical protein